MKLRFILSAVSVLFLMPNVFAQASQALSASRSEASIEVVAMLEHDWNAKKLKPGDKLSLQVIQDVVAEGRILIPRGSKVIGHVVSVAPLANPNGESRLAVAFDSARVKSHEPISFHGLVEALAPPLPDPSRDAEMALASPYDSTQMGHPVPGATGPTNMPNQEIVRQTRDGGVAALKDRERALNHATNVNVPETQRQGALSPGSHGIFGYRGMFLSNGGGASTIIAVAKNIDIKSGSQLVLSLVLTQTPSASPR